MNLSRRLSIQAAALVGLAAALVSGASGVEPVVISEGARSKLPIVIHGDAGETTKAVAEELGHYLKQIGGAEFEIRTGDAQRGILVGTIVEFPLPRFRERLAVAENRDGAESFVICPDGESLYLVGATELGASHAVFRFLERLGCRWFFPAPQWEIVPKLDRIVADFEEVDRPRIISRRIWWGYGFFDRREGRCQADYEAWARHNRMAESLRTYTGHAWQSIIAENRKTFDEHPEYLALVEGERRGPQLCVSNPAVRRIAADWALRRLEARPEYDMISMETSDGSNHCECEACEKLGSISNRAFGLANEVARVVQAKMPGKMVGMLAYNDHCEPPPFDLEPNVYIQSTAGFIRGRYTFDELMELWPRKIRNIGFYEYFSVWLWDFDQLPGGRANNLDLIAERIRKYADIGATSLCCESGNNWGPHGRGYYVANKLMWNPDEDVDEILADFYESAFGPAAAPVRRFYERFDGGRNPLMSEHLLALGFRDLQEATRLARHAADVTARLDHLKQYLHYVKIKWELDHLPRTEVAKRKDLTLDGLTWCYRTRYSYMNHWAAMWLSWTDNAAEEFEEPGWSYRHAGPQPWKADEPVTPAETERVFQADLARFQPQELYEREFSSDLVWSRLTNPHPETVKPRPLLHSFQRPMRYAVASKAGEPIRFRITTGVIKHYRDRADARWTVTDADGAEIGTGRLPQDGEVHEIEVAVSGQGLFWIDYEDQGAGWSIEADDAVPISLAIQRAKRILHLGQFRHPVFFYVPPETKRVQFYWEGGSLKPKVHGPDGELLAEIDTSGKYVCVEVPRGADGKAWFFTSFAPRRIWFTNAPNFLASSPEQLLVPAELLP